MGALLSGLLCLGSPAILYAGLAALPMGRAAWVGLGLALALVAALWASRAAGAGPLFTGVPRADAEATWLLAFWTGAAALALAAQALRPWIRRRWGPGRYGLAATLLPLLVLAALLPRFAL